MAKKIGKLTIYFLLVCIGYIYLEPLIKMVSMAIMSSDDIIDPAVEWIARKPTFDNFKIAASVLKVKKSMITSLVFSASIAVLQTIVSAMTGYALSRFKFSGKKFWFTMILFTFIMPVTVLMIPRLMIFVGIRTVFGIQLLGTPIPQALMAVLGQGINGTILILIFWNFFNMIPYTLDEAAMIDGAGPFRVFYHIAVRLSLSTVLIVFLLAFVWNWNETYQAATYLGGKLELMPLKLASFDAVFNSESASAGGDLKLNEAYKMAATLISIAPLLILYAFVQKQFIQGIENTGITGE
ncbi:MAG: carbohydrate ABC transporter permease [Lachnospiraceae bacterium]|nr:carbohydrate ABC transporter permease [Lachnospiraceae bacterium]